MSEEPKRWKRGDIGPDGRVYWGSNSTCPNGEQWVTSKKYEEMKAYSADYYKRNALKLRENARLRHKKNYKPKGEGRGRKRGPNYEKNKQHAEKARARKMGLIPPSEPIYKVKGFTSKEWKKQVRVRYNARRSFGSKDGSTFESFCRSAWHPQIFGMIANLQPDPGQTLAELIHELSGYPMEVCEMIANPPPVEEPPTPEKLDNPAPPSTLPGGPDLF